MSGILVIVREMSGIVMKIREMSGECQGISHCLESGHPYTDFCTYCCGHTGVSMTNDNQIFC
jgi:hypothetical protein